MLTIFVNFAHFSQKEHKKGNGRNKKSVAVHTARMSHNEWA